MKWILTVALLQLTAVFAVDYVCPDGKSKKSITIKKDQSFLFDIAPGYGAKSKCGVVYKPQKKGKTRCKKIKFSCTTFDLPNKSGPPKCKKGDKLKVGKQFFCKTKAPEVESTKPIKLMFLSDKKDSSGVATCSVMCADSATTTPPPSPTTAGPGVTGGTGSSYTQAWLRGEGPSAHVHEGIRLADKSGWVGIGETLPNEGQSRRSRVLVRYVNNEAVTQWSTLLGDTGVAHSVGYSVIEGDNALYIGIGLWQASSSRQMPAVVALDKSTGNTLWTTVLGSGTSNHGGVRSCIMDGQDIVCAGYVNYEATGFIFVADEGTPAVWRLDSSGNVVTEKTLAVEGMGQLAKIRKDASSGFIACSTAWGVMGGQDVNVVALVKLTSGLDKDWSATYGLAGGNSQVFDMLVDTEGNYLLGGHTTVGDGVVNWDYLALKVDSQSRQEVWRRTYGQPRGFDARYIHDEMYGVALDNSGNYLLLGGSGDEYPYSASGSGQWSGWVSDTWGSYLVVVSPSGDKLYENFYGTPDGNNAGEWLSYSPDTGDIMVYTDSDTAGGFGFLKLSPA